MQRKLTADPCVDADARFSCEQSGRIVLIGKATTVLINGGSIASWGIRARGNKYYFARIIPALRNLRGKWVKIVRTNDGFAVCQVWWQRLMWWRYT